MDSKKTSMHGPHFLITAEGSLHGEDTPENRELVRRIHACVNACEGISTEELEKGIIQDMCRALQQVVPLLQQQGLIVTPPPAEPEENNQTESAGFPDAEASGTLRSPVGKKASVR